MREGAGFNWRTGTLFILLIVGYGAYQFRDLFTVYEQLQNVVKINDQLTLYITQVEKSSLSKDTYNYYLYDAQKSTDDFMAHIKNVDPVMVTDDDKATTTVKAGQIYFRVRGNVYSFSNVGSDVGIHLDAAQY